MSSLVGVILRKMTTNPHPCYLLLPVKHYCYTGNVSLIRFFSLKKKKKVRENDKLPYCKLSREELQRTLNSYKVLHRPCL